MPPLERYLSKQRVKTLDGEKLYKFRLLRKKEAARIYHNTVATILTAIVAAAEGAGAMAKLDAISAIDFETIWDLASSLLRGCIIHPEPDNSDKMITISSLDETEYFDEYREELYIAVYYGLRANYPKSWGRVEKALEDFGPKLEAMAKTLSPIASMPASSAPTTSPSSLASTPTKSRKRGPSRSS